MDCARTFVEETLRRTPMAVAARKAGRALSSAANKSTPTKSSARGAAPNNPQFDKNQDLAAYNDMLLIRRFEEKSGQMYGMGLIGGFFPPYIGQGAGGGGLQVAPQGGDQGITGYPGHGP